MRYLILRNENWSEARVVSAPVVGPVHDGGGWYVLTEYTGDLQDAGRYAALLLLQRSGYRLLPGGAPAPRLPS